MDSHANGFRKRCAQCISRKPLFIKAMACFVNGAGRKQKLGRLAEFRSRFAGVVHRSGWAERALVQRKRRETPLRSKLGAVHQGQDTLGRIHLQISCALCAGRNVRQRGLRVQQNRRP